MKTREEYRVEMGIPFDASFEHSAEDIRNAVSSITRQYPDMHPEDALNRSLARLDAKRFQAKAPELPTDEAEHVPSYKWELWAIIVLMLVLIFSVRGHAQVTAVRGIAKGTTPANSVTVEAVDGNTNAFPVTIKGGGGSGGGPADTAPNASASESDVARQKVTTVLRLLDVSLGAGVQLVTAKGTQAGGLWVECKIGCAGGSSTPTDTFANPTTAGLGMSFAMGWNGTTWDRLRTDTTSGLWVNIKNASIPVTGTFWQATQPVSGTFWQATQPVSLAAAVDVSDRAVRLLGVTYGSQGQQLQQSATNFNLYTELRTGGTAYDARSIRALTNADVVKSQLQDNAGNGLTTNSTTYTAKFGLDGNWLGTLGTAFTTPGFVDIKGADGNVFVRNATAANFKIDLSGSAANATAGLISMKIDQTTPGTTNGVQVNAALPAGSNIIGNFRIDQTTPGTTNGVRTDTSGATGAAPPSRAELSGYLGSGATGGLTTAAPVGDTYKNINVSTATTTLLITGVSGRQVHITSLHMLTAAANNVALIEGTGATCGTGTAGMAGGTTAATGYNLAANGGMTGVQMQTATAGDSVCVITSAGTQLSGGILYAIY